MPPVCSRCRSAFRQVGSSAPSRQISLASAGVYTHLQAQCGSGGRVALILARVIVVIPLQLEAAKDALNPDGFPALANLPGFRLVASIGLIGGFLEQPADQGIGGFEHRRAHQDFQLGDALAMHLPGFKAGDQLLHFFFLREADGGRAGIFFLAAAMFWRVS